MDVTVPGAPEGSSRPELRVLALTVVALVLLAIVGAASSTSAWHTTTAGSGVNAPTTALKPLASAAGVIFVGSLLLIWIETPKSRPRKRTRGPAVTELDELGPSLWTAGKTVAVVVLTLAVFCIAMLPLLSRQSAPPAPPAGLNPAATPGSIGNKGGKAADSLHLGWLLLPMAIALTVFTPAAVLIRRRLQQNLERSPDEPSELGVVRASIAALESERDPRRAILRAYAHMENAFGDVEMARARDETASEFLARTAQRLPKTAGSAAELTERFEEARFSTHALTQADRQRALASLRRVEEELTK